MPIATPTFRVFISSTFEDLKAERDALQREVFPKLRKFCEEQGARFQAIDLRWGVRDEAALDQQTVEICLREIRRCQATGVKPNFIVLLGDRYGWQPLPPRIRAPEFDALLTHIQSGDARALAEQWYRLDKNAVPPEYCLQPRSGDFATPAAWNPVQQALREALARAARAAGLPQTELIKYESSATHQEILAGLGQTEADRRHVFGLFRRSMGETHARLEELKAYLRAHLRGNTVEFDPGDLAGLCDTVFSHVRQVIESEVKRFEDLPALDLEVEAHDRFAKERCRIFTGRQAVLDTIADYIRGPERRPLVLHGESGSGKSAVMAKASQQYKGPGRVIRRFIGASPESASGHALLTSLCREIAPGETPVDYVQLENTFKKRLSVAAPQQPLVLFVDALDQLAVGDPARDATWLPPKLPPDVKVIVSTTTDGGRLPDGLPVQLERMPQSEGEHALKECLGEARRTLQPWQREIVLAHFGRCGLPLYLKLAAEESELWKSYATEDACTLGEGVAGVLDTLFDRLASNANHGPTLVERSLGYLAAARYGLTEDEILDVLTEDDAVWSDFEQRKHHEVSERRLPVVVWSRLSVDLEPYLTERVAPGGKVITFYHRQLAERVAGRFLAGAERQDRHSDLARHFSAKPVWVDEARKLPNARRAVELAFQQRSAHQWSQAEETLFDSQFLFAKALGMVLDLDADYQALLHQAPARTLPRREALELIHGALRLSMHVLAQGPAQFASQIVGRLLPHQEAPAVKHFTESVIQSAPRPWLRPLTPCLTGSGGPLVRILVSDYGAVENVWISADGSRLVSESWANPAHSGYTTVVTVKVWELESGRELYSWTSWSPWIRRCLAVSADGRRAVFRFVDHPLEVWDLERGRELHILAGHSGAVDSAALSADGRRAAFAYSDHTVKVWDLENGRELRTLAGHSGQVSAVAMSGDGRRVCASVDNTVNVWDLENGRELRILAGHSGAVYRVAISADGGRAAFASSGDAVEVWDLENGRELRSLAGHSGLGHSAVAMSGDGRRVVCACGDNTAKVWDLESGRELRILAGHSAKVNCVAVNTEGRLAVSASSDGTFKIWDLESGHEPCTGAGRSVGVTCVAPSADGRRAVSASHHEALKVWDMETGRELRTLSGHSDEVNSVALSGDGQRAVSASDDQTLKVWELEAGRELGTLSGHSGRVKGVAMSGDGRRAVSASDDQTLKVWDLQSGRELRTLIGHSASVDAVAMTVDGRRAVSASKDRTLKVWDLEIGRELRTLVGHLGYDNCVALSADGRRAMSGSCNGPTQWLEDESMEVPTLPYYELKMWDLERGHAMHTLSGDSDRVFAVAVSSEGGRAFCASDERCLKVWDLDTGTVVTTFTLDVPLRCCAFAGARKIVAGDAGGRVYFLALEE